MKSRLPSMGPNPTEIEKDNKLYVKKYNDEWTAVITQRIESSGEWRQLAMASISIFGEHLGSLSNIEESRMYLGEILTFKVDEEITIPNTEVNVLRGIKNNLEELGRLYKRIMKRGGFSNFAVRLELENSIVVIYINLSSQIPDECFMAFMEFDLEKNVLAGRTMILSLNDLGNMVFSETIQCSYYTGLSPSRVNAYATNAKNKIFDIKFRVTKLISIAFTKYLEAINDSKIFDQHFIYPEHQDFELKMIMREVRHIVHTKYHGQDSVFLQLNTWLMEMDPPDLSFERYMEKCLNHAEYLINNYTSIPIIDLNNKEFDFINNFIRENNYDISNGNKIDIREFLNYSRYGNLLRWYKDDTNYEEDSVSVSYDIDIQKDYAIFYVGHFSEKDLLLEVVECINLSEFSLKNSVRAVQILLYRNIDSDEPLYTSPQDIIDTHGIDITKYEATLNAIWDTIKIHIISYLRPERTKILRITERSTESKGPNRPNVPKHESNIIVRRIMKTTYDARKYLKRVAHEHGEGVEREYTIESWTRVGHWRKTKNGPPIWIEPTTCHRNADLLGTEKEVHIKL